MMVALVVVLIGFALVLGKNDLAERGLKILAGLVLVVTFLPGLSARADFSASGCRSQIAPGDGARWLIDALAFAVLAGIGLAAWRMRSLFAKRRESTARAWGSPRDRALPPPRSAGGEEPLP